MTKSVQLEDECNGYESGAKFKLTNGQVWEQTSSRYLYRYRYRPTAVLDDASGWSGRIQIDGCGDEWVNVRRVS
jgi:hypothetical protein